MKVDDDDDGDGDNDGEHLLSWLWSSDESYIRKEVMSCDVSPVAMFVFSTHYG